MSWHRNPILRHLAVRPPLALSVALGLLFFLGLPAIGTHTLATRYLLAWNAGACLYLVLAAVMIAQSNHARIRQRALQQDEGARTVLLLVTVAVIASLVAIVVELSATQAPAPEVRRGRIALTALTVVSSWFLAHLVFAVHYAHDYYLNLERKLPPGISFPGELEPDYGDFLYLAGIIGTSGQTADVSFTSRGMRRIALAHCVLAFFFNTTVLALSINIAAGLLQN